MADVTVTCGDTCVGCNDQCAACSAQMCADCGGCEHGREMDRRARAATANLALAIGGDELAMPQDLAEYWLHGEGADKIRWCTEGSFRRAQRALRGKVPADQLDGTVANLYRRACGKHPSPHDD